MKDEKCREEMGGPSEDAQMVFSMSNEMVGVFKGNYPKIKEIRMISQSHWSEE